MGIFLDCVQNDWQEQEREDELCEGVILQTENRKRQKRKDSE